MVGDVAKVDVDCQEVDITSSGPYSMMCCGVSTVSALCCSYYLIIIRIPSSQNCILFIVAVCSFGACRNMACFG